MKKIDLKWLIFNPITGISMGGLAVNERNMTRDSVMAYFIIADA
ncbi:MAG TPA: hypothetical protein VD884_11690 [Ohtaekwangia sp.]|nr:hypothetical protein [Ohtaekwangia sp.]